MTPSPSTRELPDPLRIGILLDDWRVPAWIVRVVEEIHAAPAYRVVLVVVRRDGAPRRGVLARLWERRSHLAYELYARLDRKLLSSGPDPFERVSLAPLLEGCPTIHVEPRKTEFSDYFPAAALQEIRAHDLDVALRFGFRILRGEALEIARHGVWSFHHDDNRVIRGGPPGFWEVMEGHPVTGSLLQVLTERLDAGKPIYRSWAPTHRRSVHRNRAHVYWKSAAFVERCLESLARTGEAAAGAAADAAEEAYRPYSWPLYRKPTNARAVPLLARFATRAGREWLIDRLSRKQWFLAFSTDGKNEEEGVAPELFRFRTIIPPPDRYWADPFPVAQGDRWHVFLEEYFYESRRGRISVLEIDAAGGWSAPEPVLERTHHLSYPFVFRWRDETFLVPESAEARKVELFRCRSFPGSWEVEGTLLEGVRAVDATLHREEDRWWMFANVAAEEASHCHDELHLFHADTPLGPWTPHPANPVVSDAQCARPAGRLFRWRGQLLRPAQDCSRRYGHAVTIQRVLRLTRTEYREETASRIEPRWRPGLLGTHTLNRAGRLVMVDAMRRVPRFGLPRKDRSRTAAP